jgi:hypothetical protein
MSVRGDVFYTKRLRSVSCSGQDHVVSYCNSIGIEEICSIVPKDKEIILFYWVYEMSDQNFDPPERWVFFSKDSAIAYLKGIID